VDMVVWYMLKAMYMKEHGKMTKQMDLVTTPITMEAGMKVSGLRTSKMVRALRNGQMVQSTQDSIRKVKSTGTESLSGLIRAPMRVTFLIIIFMVLVNTSGLMAEYLMAIGSKTEWKAKVSLHGAMAVNMLENTKTIKNTDMVYSHGLMADAMMVSGTKVSSMEKEYT